MIGTFLLLNFVLLTFYIPNLLNNQMHTKSNSVVTAITSRSHSNPSNNH